MIYALSLLLLLLGLVIAIPAIRRLVRMHAVRKNKGTTTGRVISTKSAMNTGGWLLGSVSASEFVNHERPLVTYEIPQGKEMSVEVVPSNFLSRKKYTIDETVEVAYDLSQPWHAYLIREWNATLRETWIGTGLCVLGIILWIVGRVNNLPF